MELEGLPRAEAPSGLDVLHPQAFVLSNMSVDPARALRAVESIDERGGPSGAAWSASDVLTALEARHVMEGRSRRAPRRNTRVAATRRIQFRQLAGKADAAYSSAENSSPSM